MKDGKVFEQGPRAEEDGPIEIRASGSYFQIVATHRGVVQHLTVSKYNACRILGSLASMLGARLLAAHERKIQM